jgi:hypothetical protein
LLVGISRKRRQPEIQNPLHYLENLNLETERLAADSRLKGRNRAKECSIFPLWNQQNFAVFDVTVSPR